MHRMVEVQENNVNFEKALPGQCDVTHVTETVSRLEASIKQLHGQKAL